MSRQVVDRLVHYIEEQYGKDEGKLAKLRHDIECGIAEVLEQKDKDMKFYKDAYDRKCKVVKGFNEVKLKCRTENIHRVHKWFEDVLVVKSIRKQHGYKDGYEEWEKLKEEDKEHETILE